MDGYCVCCGTPEISKCANGKWLAVTPAGSQFCFGVVAESYDLAASKYQESLAQWQAALDDDPVIFAEAN